MSYGKGDFGKNPPPVFIPQEPIAPKVGLAKILALLFVGIVSIGSGIIMFFVNRDPKTFYPKNDCPKVEVPDPSSTLFFLVISICVMFILTRYRKNENRN